MQAEVATIRHSVAWSRMSHATWARLSGEDAFAVLDRLCPAEILLRDGQLLHSLFLDEQGRPFADVYIGRDDEHFLLVSEGPTAAALAGYVRTHAGNARIELTLFDESHDVLSLNGPYAWELLGEVVGPEVVGLPYANLFHYEQWLCFRAGKTGEYGYDLLVPRAQSAALQAKIEGIGQRFELGHAGLEALDQCALENWFFNIRREGSLGLTPMELQLQWRVSRRKDHVGAEALRRHRDAGVRQRVTYVMGAERFAVGDPVTREGEPVGRIINAGLCQPRGEWVGLALLDLPVAHSGLSGFTAGAATVRTLSPPVLANRSLFVNPQRHSFFTRAEESFPPLVWS